MTHAILSFIRGINVGGNNIVKMAEFRQALEHDGFIGIKTYIQSGNVIFLSDSHNLTELSKKIENCLKKHFRISARVVSFSGKQWQSIIKNAPEDWGKHPDWKHNILILLDPKNGKEVLDAIGELKPDIESIKLGKGVLYQSISRDHLSRSSSSKLPAKAISKEMTIRNFNTSKKLLSLLKERE